MLGDIIMQLGYIQHKEQGRGLTPVVRHTTPVEWVTADYFLIKTRCSAIAERPRCRVPYTFRQK